MSNAIILANGFPPRKQTLERALSLASCFVCADGGANVAREFGLTPDAIIGDLDSATPETLKHFLAVPTIRDASTERTDTEKALTYTLDRGPFDEIGLYGASAGRLDHVLGHISILRRHAGNTRLVLEDDRSRAWIVRESSTLDYPVGTVISFFAVGGPAEGVTTTNLTYPLSNRRLEMGTLDSISNSIHTRPARVEIARGELLLFVVTEP